jgi:hypothetical protein
MFTSTIHYSETSQVLGFLTFETQQFGQTKDDSHQSRSSSSQEKNCKTAAPRLNR